MNFLALIVGYTSSVVLIITPIPVIVKYYPYPGSPGTLNLFPETHPGQPFSKTKTTLYEEARWR
jgi:hypothetical protein